MSKNDDLVKVFEEQFARKYKNTAGGGSFMTGLAFGAALGGAAVFFTKTEKGRKAWKKLKKEWEKSKSKMVKDGVLEHAEHGLEDWLKHMMEKLSDGAKKSKPVKPTKKTSPSKKVAKKPARKRVRKKKETFKGV